MHENLMAANERKLTETRTSHVRDERWPNVKFATRALQPNAVLVRNHSVRISLKTVENVAYIFAAMVVARHCAASAGFARMGAVASNSTVDLAR